MNTSQLAFNGLKTLSKTGSSATSGTVTYGSIIHDPASFENPSQFYVYQFAVQNLNTEIAIVNFKASNRAIWTQSLERDTWFANERPAGDVIYYEFNAAVNDPSNIRSFNVILQSLNGDADLFVSTSNRAPSHDSAHEWAS